MEDAKVHHIPAFGNWGFCDELPITRYFESASQAGLFQGHFYGEGDDLYKVAEPTKPVHYHHHHHHHRKDRKREGAGEKKREKEQQQKKQGRVYDVTNQPTRRPIVPKPIDEDLYKIPPELLYQKPKRVKLLRNFWSGCLGLNCVN